MALKWAWGFSTDQTTTKLTDIGWTFENTTNLVISSTETHTYSGDAVSNRASLRCSVNSWAHTPYGVVALDGWACTPLRCGGWHFNHALRVGDATTGIYWKPTTFNVASSTMKLYVGNVYKAESATSYVATSWNYFALKYEGSGTTFKGTLYVNGVEAIPEQSETGMTAWAGVSVLRVSTISPSYPNYAYYGGFITYDSTSDAGQTEVWCSTMEPTGDHTADEAGSWTPTNSSSNNYSQVTPWNTATYTQNTTPVSGTDQIVLTCPTISAHLGISPPVYAVVSQSVVSGGSDFQALVHVGGSYIGGTTVTSDANDPTYGFSTVATGLSASTVVRIGTKTP